MGQFIRSHALRHLYEAKGREEFTRLIVEGLEAHRDPDGDKSVALDPAHFSLKEIAEATNFPYSRDIAMVLGREATDYTTFPTITEQVIQSFMIPGWNQVKGLSDLCIGVEFETKDDPLRVPGMTDPGGLLERGFGGQYAETTLKELYVQVSLPPKPWGRIITLYEEDIAKDKTGQLKVRAAGVGKAAAIMKEKEFWYSFADAGTAIETHACYAYYPAGTRTAIYALGTSDTTGQTPHHSLYASNTLADITDVQNADSYLALQTDMDGNLITIPGTRLLIVPRALRLKARLIKRTQMLEKGKGPAAGYVIPTAATGGIGDEDEDFDILVAPYLDGISTSTWYWGVPKAAWVRAVFYPLQVASVNYGPGDPPYMTRDIAYQARARYYAKSFALDYRYVVKST